MRLTLYHLVVRPTEGYYNQEWNNTVLRVVKTYSSKFILSEESGAPDKSPNHIDCALWMRDEDTEAFNKAYQRAVSDFPAESKSNRTKRISKNPNAEKYACKEDHTKVYEGYTDTDIVTFQSLYHQETEQRDSNYPFKMLARKIAISVIDNFEDYDEMLDESLPTISAKLVYENLLTVKEYNRCTRMSTIIRINLEEMKIKWRDHVAAIRSEIYKKHQEIVDAQNAKIVRQSDIARKQWEDRNALLPEKKRSRIFTHGTNREAVDEELVEKEVRAQVDLTKAADVL